jgi:hypothetical protein
MMKGPDRLLAVMVAAVIVLAVVAFVLAINQTEPTYVEPEDTPEAVVHNYLLALRLGDNERARGYLYPELEGYPQSEQEFVETVSRYRWQFPTEDTASAFDVGRSEVTGDLAVLEVEETRFTEAGLVDTGQVYEDFVVQLKRAGGAWRISHSERYWTECWEDPSLERCERGVAPEEPIDIAPPPTQGRAP